jgi:hypothetical protein
VLSSAAWTRGIATPARAEAVTILPLHDKKSRREGDREFVSDNFGACFMVVAPQLVH